MGSFTDGKLKESEFTYNDYYLARPFEQLLKAGKIPMSVLDDKVSRVLRTIFRTAMNPNRIIGNQCSEAHYDACRQIAEEGIVLLKNTRNLLPLDTKKYGKILVVGENATRSLTKGGGSSELKTLYDISPLEGLKALYGDKIDYAQGYESGGAHYDKIDTIPVAVQTQLRKEALEKARKADIILYIGGLNKNHLQDCENGDREDYNLSFGQNELIAGLAALKKPVVVITFGGNSYATPWIDNVGALVHCWYLGSESGTALANVLSGKVNPSGKLPITFAVKQNDYPCFAYGAEGFPGVNYEEYYREGIFVGYRHFDTRGIKARFPFGYGQSYTTFKYGRPTLSSRTIAPNGHLTLTVAVTNTGKRAGKEIVQLYIGDDKASVERPRKELKGFRKIALMPGETRTVTFDITTEDLQFFSEKEHRWVAEPGTFKAYVCASSEDVRGTAAFELR